MNEEIKKPTKIVVDEETVKKLCNFGKMNEEYNDIISKMIEHISTCDKWWQDRY